MRKSLDDVKAKIADKNNGDRKIVGEWTRAEAKRDEERKNGGDKRSR